MNTYKLRLHSSLSRSILCIAATLAPVVALSGCSIGAGFPDASANPQQVPLGTIRGSNYGGHAPLIGAHVYVLQPSVTTPTAVNAPYDASYNAYGGRATSLLSASYQNNGQSNSNGTNYNATSQNTGGDPGVPSGWYYQTTDLTGAFNISGDYTCMAGVPVYLYIYGGSPTYPSANNTFNIASWSATGSSGAYTVTMTINTSGALGANPIENAYIGEGLTIASTTSATPTGTTGPFSGSFQYVDKASLTTTTFSFIYTGSALPNGAQTNTTYTQTAQGSSGTSATLSNMQVTFEPSFNTGVVNLAVLGNCPSSGGFTGSNAISYVYVNEVSTVAAAYAFRPFTFTPSTLALNSNDSSYQTACTNTYNGTVYYWNSATCIGTSSTNLAGLQNAATLAGQLYDITGSNITTSYAGEGHIARASNTTGNGIVPQANLDTLGNILAACVDSSNGSTVVGTGGSYQTNSQGGVSYSGISAQCNTLFSTATSSGVLSTASSNPGLQPFDTAMAAFNIARHPAGPPYSVTGTAPTGTNAFVQALYQLPQANVPFTPNLTMQPNDFTIGILYPQSLNEVSGSTSNAYTNTAESVAIDKIGNVWVTAQNGHSSSAPAFFYELSPIGARSNIQSNTSYIYGYVTIDSGGSAWAGAAIDTLNYNNSTPYAAPFTYVHVSGTSSSPNPATGSYGYPVPYTYSAGATNSTKLESYTYASISDASGNVYFGNNGTYSSNSVATGRPLDYIDYFAGAATTPTVGGSESAQIPTFTSKNGGITHAAMQSTSTSAYIDYNNSDTSGTSYISRVALPLVANNTGFPMTPSTSGCSALTDPETIALTRSGAALIADFDNAGGSLNTATSNLWYITQAVGTTAGTCAQISGLTQEAGLYSPFGVAIDGNDYAYITNRGNYNGTTISVLNMQSNSSTVASVSPSTGYQPQYQPSGGSITSELNGPLNIAIGPSGEAWITNASGNSLVELIGIALPATTPLSAAATSSSATFGAVGNRP